jgi:hypothetical protein
MLLKSPLIAHLNAIYIIESTSEISLDIGLVDGSEDP